MKFEFGVVRFLASDLRKKCHMIWKKCDACDSKAGPKTETVGKTIGMFEILSL